MGMGKFNEDGVRMGTISFTVSLSIPLIFNSRMKWLNPLIKSKTAVVVDCI